jgi:hypothetical protein
MQHVPEFEVEHTGVFDDNKFWDLTVEYAKNDPTDTSIRITVENCSSSEATLTLLPQLYYRNTWSWHAPDSGFEKPVMRADSSSPSGVVAILCDKTDGLADPMTLLCHDVSCLDDQLLFCDNETNMARFDGRDICRDLYKSPNTSGYPKDCINNAVVNRDPTLCHPQKKGSKVAITHQISVPAGSKRNVYFRFLPTTKAKTIVDHSKGEESLEIFDGGVYDLRKKEADDFFRWLTPSPMSDDRRIICRQAFAGMIWNKQVGPAASRHPLK